MSSFSTHAILALSTPIELGHLFYNVIVGQFTKHNMGFNIDECFKNEMKCLQR
jgi:hypothetical protein